MLDIGWGELLIIGVVALIVVGPKDLPGLFKTAGQFMGRARGMAREFQRSMEAAADESGLKEASQSLKSLDRLHLGGATSSARKYAESLVKDVDAAVGGATPSTPATPAPTPTMAPAAEPVRAAPLPTPAPAPEPAPAADKAAS